jgi:hypothetical protein
MMRFKGMPHFLGSLPVKTKDFVALKKLSPWNPYRAFIFMPKRVVLKFALQRPPSISETSLRGRVGLASILKPKLHRFGLVSKP